MHRGDKRTLEWYLEREKEDLSNLFMRDMSKFLKLLWVHPINSNGVSVVYFNKSLSDKSHAADVGKVKSSDL